MSKLKRPLEDPLHEEVDRSVAGGGEPTENQYFADDALACPYYTDTDKLNHYIHTDPA